MKKSAFIRSLLMKSTYHLKVSCPTGHWASFLSGSDVRARLEACVITHVEREGKGADGSTIIAFCSGCPTQKICQMHGERDSSIPEHLLQTEPGTCASTSPKQMEL